MALNHQNMVRLGRTLHFTQSTLTCQTMNGFFGAVVRSGKYVDQITFISKSASVPFNVVGPFGESTRRALLKNGATFAAEIKGFYGHSGIGIHRLGFKGPLFT